MTTPVYKLTNEEISDKANRIISKLHASDTITDREASILRTCLGRYEWAQSRVETTERWAQEAFTENKRLTDLIAERWRAGYKGKEQDCDGQITLKPEFIKQLTEESIVELSEGENVERYKVVKIFDNNLKLIRFEESKKLEADNEPSNMG